MKISCNVIKDILPLYVEGLASEDTRKIVEEHINTCDHCRKEFEEMDSSKIIPIDTDIKPLEKITITLRRKKLQTMILSIMITIVIGIVVISFLTAPEYINDETSVSIVENTDGSIILYNRPYCYKRI